MTQIRAKCSLKICFPILNKTTNVIIPQMALGKRALNSLTPKTFMLKTCIQKKSGGFSVKRVKLI